MGSLIKTQSRLKNRDRQNLDTCTPVSIQSHSHARFDPRSLPLSLTHTHTPLPATRAVYQVIIVWLQRFIICTDWVRTDGKGQASLTRRSRNIFPRPAACLPSLSSERANCKCICLRKSRALAQTPPWKTAGRARMVSAHMTWGSSQTDAVLSKWLYLWRYGGGWA